MRDPIHIRTAQPQDAAAIWALYQKTGFLYPAKLAAMGDGGHRARATFEALLSLPSDDYRVVLGLDAEERLRSVCTYARFSDAQSWVMHLASDHDRRALLFTLDATGYRVSTSGAPWLAYTFRENNASVRRLFTAPLHEVSASGWSVEFEAYDFYTIDACRVPCLSRRLSRAVRPASERDRRFFLKHLADQPGECTALQAQGMFPAGGREDALVGRLRRAGLPRERAAFVVDGDDGPVALAVADVSPQWWNLSNLGTGLRLWERTDDREAAAALFSFSARWFAERSVTSWTALIGSNQWSLSQLLNEAGLTSERRYLRLGVPMAASPILSAAHARFIGRSTERTAMLQTRVTVQAREMARAA